MKTARFDNLQYKLEKIKTIYKNKEMKPLHYENNKGYDLIDVATDYKLNFFRFNVLKYICRAGKKQDEIKDLEKAIDYLEREIQYLRKWKSIFIEENK